MKAQSVTLKTPDDLLRQLNILAAKQDTSISALVTRCLLQIADAESGYAGARNPMLEDLRKEYR
jgi:predicted transcriptional regulator